MKRVFEDNGSLKLIFIRHAKPNYDDCGDRDISDGDLDETGIAQCVSLGQRFKDIPVDAFFSSSLLRAYRTAAAICREKEDQPQIEICPEVMECGTTRGYYGCSAEYLRRYYPNAKMCDTKIFGTEEYEFGCITEEENRLRAEKFVDYLKNRFTYGQCAVVVCHYAISEHLVAAALGIKERDFHFAFTYTSATMVEIFPEGYSLLRCLNAMD